MVPCFAARSRPAGPPCGGSIPPGLRYGYGSSSRLLSPYLHAWQPRRRLP